jgi:penicillin-insensitive murein endopeptidase
VRAVLAGLAAGALLAGAPRARAEDAAAAARAASAAAREALRLVRGPAPGPAQAIGAYTNGCLAGGQALPPTGPGYEVLHLGRHRRHGHPILVRFVERLGRAVRDKGLGLLLVGDLAQPRGGPTPTGHRSHQSGLDVDIGYTFPPFLRRRKLTPAEREALMPPAVVDLGTMTLTPAWRASALDVLALAAGDPAVDRIFVHAAVKRAACDRSGGPGAAGAWLRKLRPWWGHHDHFHVRLACPPGSAACEPQAPLPSGDGCDALAWWGSEDARKAQQERRQAAAAEPPPPLPGPCLRLVPASDPGRSPDADPG